jgi:SAM-dependent methyltransferase
MKIDNRLASFFYDRLDFPIRFLYSQLYLNKMFFWKLYASDFKKLDSKFEELKKIIDKLDKNFKNKICLELGPGNSYINAYNFLMHGAKKVILVDKYPRYIKTKKQIRYFQKELDYILKKYKKKNLFFIKKDQINLQYIQLVSQDISGAQIKDKIDFIYSISVLEHIKNIEGDIKQLSKIIKKGGLIYHSIDLRDHYNFNNPFLFLKYPKKVWEKYLTK